MRGVLKAFDPKSSLRSRCTHLREEGADPVAKRGILPPFLGNGDRVFDSCVKFPGIFLPSFMG